MDASMKLHGYYRSSAAFRTRIALNLKNVPFDNIPLHLRHNEQRSHDYLAINPQGLVPTLQADGGLVRQSLAIIEYLDETHPAPAFLPSTPLDRAHVRALAQLIACDIHPINNLRVLRYLRQNFAADEDTVSTWYNHWIAEGFTALETILAADARTGTFCYGDAPGLADICLVPQVTNAGNYKLDMAPYPVIQRIFDTCMALPQFAAAHPRRQPDAE